jgi:hypothetical protein
MTNKINIRTSDQIAKVQQYFDGMVALYLLEGESVEEAEGHAWEAVCDKFSGIACFIAGKIVLDDRED